MNILCGYSFCHEYYIISPYFLQEKPPSVESGLLIMGGIAVFVIISLGNRSDYFLFEKQLVLDLQCIHGSDAVAGVVEIGIEFAPVIKLESVRIGN